ncbi:MAG TPA: hypothetical protein P5186_11285 [Candidatus Paceibacterota bacterium]|nr:hypothetical protein [Candidatus Paceibacterota bacterium]
MFDPVKIIDALNHHQVDYVVIGGIAAVLHGCPEQTYDLDILYANTEENRHRLLLALQAIGAEWDLPLNDEVLQRQPVFALNTRFGDLDIMTWVPAVEDYQSVVGRTQVFPVGTQTVRALDLPMLITTKEAAADPNPRKQSTLLYLKKIHQLQSGKPSSSNKA